MKLSGVKLPLDFQEADVKRAAAKKLRLPERAALPAAGPFHPKGCALPL